MDLIASIVALVSVRKAGEPADADHLYGHEKLENLAGAIEGALILLRRGDHHLRGDRCGSCAAGASTRSASASP